MDLPDKLSEVNDDTNLENIKPINRETVHRICSGQVVLSLAIAVKELIENAIDADAKNIDVRLKDYGMELIEVSDNGSGVRQENFKALALKHYTSKIREFTDLENLSTLGFRGEALSSLCALSDLQITTRHQNCNHGTKIDYDHNGVIKNEVSVARSVGTTVSLTNLFATLPVRRKEFVKNHKREFSKMCNLLYAYCLVSKGIRFKCVHQSAKGSSTTIIQTLGSNSLRDNVISIFGTKQLSTLIEAELKHPDEAIADEYNIKVSSEDLSQFKFDFLISSVSHGTGRSSSDRQFYYFNSRPCEPTKIIKQVNEIYRQFNSNQYPFVYLNIIVNGLIDVNVTPDKRQIFLEKEKLLLATIKATLLEAFKSFPSTFQVQNVELSSKGIKRNISDESPGKTILESFRKKSKMETSDNERRNFDYSILPASASTASIVEKTDEKLACKFSSSEKTSVVLKPIIKDDDKSDIEKGVYRKHRNVTNINISVDQIRNALAKNKVKDETVVVDNVKFHSAIGPATNKAAEQELQKQISKEMFGQMVIIGQFNYGFIIVQLEQDLFIIDQHATDEKYNFEILQRTTILDSQPLVSPKDLQLTVANQEILMENVELFAKNGFHFSIDTNAEASKKIRMTKIPVSKNIIFGKDDVDEMLFLLREGNDVNCRPSRVRAMFASRACRKSVMVGKPLTVADMRRIVDHMGEIEQPWNCPHGRPTMRHLLNINLLSKK